MKEEAASDRDAVKRVREKNSRMENSKMKMQLVDYQIRERKVLCSLLLLFAVVDKCLTYIAI